MRVKVQLRSVTEVYRDGRRELTALQDVSFAVHEGEFVAVIGPSGCGKSTLLRIIAGLQRPSAGTVELARSAANRPATAMVFQEHGLLPWRTVLDNVAFGLENRGVPRSERHRIARHFLDKVGLREFERALPHQLSGGMKQRTGIARAFASDPEVLLMDEPLGLLDAQTRILIQEELLSIWEETRKTVIYVTHSLEEALLLADRVIVVSARPGRIKAILPVTLPRPRSLELKGEREFNRLYRQLWGLLREEVVQRRGAAVEGA